jgi:dipeptidyl aminopeptidase/acylaminoacyl peptidase
MRKLVVFAGAVAVAACAPGAPAPVQAPAPATEASQARPLPYLAQLPPLIDRDVFFGDPEIAAGQLSPDGRFISFVRPLDGVMNVWIVERGQPFDAARPITDARDRPITGYFWSADGRYVLYVRDQGGDENFRVYAIDPTAPSAPGQRTPPARDLTPYEGVRAMLYSVPENTPNQILIGLNDRNPQVHDVYRVDLRTGERTLVRRNDDNVAGWVADLDGRLRLGVRQTADGGNEILRIDGQQLTRIYACSNEESCGPVRFHTDGRRVYSITNRGDTDLIGLVLLDTQTGATELVERDPENEVDFGSAVFSRVTRQLIATAYVGDRLRIYPRDPEFARDLERVRAALPGGDLSLRSPTRDDRLWLVSVTSDVDPGATYIYDRQTGEVEFLYRPRPDLPTEHLAPMRAIRYTARDGLEIPAYLTLPQGVEPRNLAVVVLPHGGPWARDFWGYDSFAQFLANRGYAVLQPNFRGSTGYGKRFLNLGNREWGTGTMQHDITDGVRFLVEQGIADPERVAIMGISYGGYATLAGLAFTPELYAAGVSIVGPSSIVTLLNSIPPYWAPVRRMFAVRVGDVDDPQDVEMLRAQSPLYSADQIRAPLLVIQGANDPRVIQAESDQIVVALRELGRTVDYIVAPDEGHGFARRENRLAMTVEVERFLAQHLGGRHQESAPDEILQRLAEIRVDVDTVRVRTAVADAGAPVAEFRGAALQPMTLRYQQTLEVGGQTLEISSSRTVASAVTDGQPVWIVVEQAQTPMGAVSDSTYLERQTLLPVRRAVQQGPATVEIHFADGRVHGKIQAGPQEMPIDANIEGRVLADGAPMELTIATLPLAPGFETTIRTFNMMQGRAATQRIVVGGVEQVQVPAGSFEVFRVETSPADGTPGGATLWIEREAPHRIVRSEARLPAQMGGGRAVSELVATD